mmetsp:Transcript_8035/g.23805  ORF Transcript_8035/g.23805 Transcript_8035/m.23805 type:complete len:257 (+) Transcript_8035:638-1408(+)
MVRGCGTISPSLSKDAAVASNTLPADGEGGRSAAEGWWLRRWAVSGGSQAGQRARAASNAGIWTGCEEARFHANPNPVLMKSVLPNWAIPEPSVPPMPPTMKRAMSPREEARPLVRRTKVTALRMYWKTVVPHVVTAKSCPMWSWSKSMYVCACQVGPSCHDAGSSDASSLEPVFCCCSSTPHASRPISAGMKIANEAAVICEKRTPHPRNSTTASMATKPERIIARPAVPVASSYPCPRAMKKSTRKGEQTANRP